MSINQSLFWFRVWLKSMYYDSVFFSLFPRWRLGFDLLTCQKNGLLWKDSKLGVVSFVELESLLDFGTNAKQSCQSAVLLMKCRPTRILLVLLSSQLKEGSGLILLQQGLPMRECWLTSSTAFWVKRLEPPGAQDLEQLEPEFKGLPRKQV